MEKQIYMTPKQPFFVTSSRSYEKVYSEPVWHRAFLSLLYWDRALLCDSGRVCGHGVLL